MAVHAPARASAIASAWRRRTSAVYAGVACTRPIAGRDRSSSSRRQSFIRHRASPCPKGTSERLADSCSARSRPRADQKEVLSEHSSQSAAVQWPSSPNERTSSYCASVIELSGARFAGLLIIGIAAVLTIGLLSVLVVQELNGPTVVCDRYGMGLNGVYHTAPPGWTETSPDSGCWRSP